jgi:hypothetical protein
MIMNYRGVAFCFLMFLLFFCVFVVCTLWRVKAHYKGAKNVVTLYCFPRVSMFELQPW